MNAVIFVREGRGEDGKRGRGRGGRREGGMGERGGTPAGLPIFLLRET